jgi:AraC family transcriptional regulator
MLIYVNSGFTDYSRKPVPIFSRPAWEFQACLTGLMSANLCGTAPCKLRERTMWVFPKEFPHGWDSSDAAERVVFHHTVVPAELERFLPSRGYYRIRLDAADCDRLRALAERTLEMMKHPDEMVSLRTRALVDELSLMALREAKPQPLSSRSMAYAKTERALAWYLEHIDEAPGFERIAAAVFVSPAHLRRLFHQARGESPQKAFNRVRMGRVRDLLDEQGASLDEIAERVGMSSASALSRAVKAHFGKSPLRLRRC